MLCILKIFIQDAFGVHVIEKIIEHIEEDIIQPIYDTVLNNYINLSCNVNGLCVAKKILIKSRKLETIIKLKNIIAANSLQMCQHQCATYVIHVALDVILR